MVPLEDLVLQAVDTARYNRGILIFQLGLSTVGIAVIMIAAGLCFHKPKDAAPKISSGVRWTALIILGAIGVGIIAYAWLGF